MKETLKLILTLTIISCISGLVLAFVNGKTKDKIALIKSEAKVEAMNSVLPAHDNDPMKDAYRPSGSDSNIVFYVAKSADKFVGAAFDTSTMSGFSGYIGVMVGVNADNEISAIQILSQNETPGLGANITKNSFLNQFKNMMIPTDATLKVKKDGGKVEQITGATISSRAVSEAISSGLKVFEANKKEIITND
ncbi:MAG: RnfABCDGE type electron transport complex subunit G [Kiritimatiellae bacterium]|jgi:electron transport complex protein RnfG|nr:RnfABCDGE type electron transport complex subunit G [Kiritimatiellia bacterium]